ncbi:hypothetical protein LHYA1_G009077 [Lachnellula hyalina]|uniref:Carboxylesterase family protein n=1 Tax=Lachnellula hyalina TaxID=1316788 RepID=A0A8H8QT70_9HELO|nr:uncharacterized protein LHYA1_G009077 [Lachnellula hyalina]TVY22304.1 hypothetical protein LHYA1_G009077 [Lachnellula hyalina]
MSRVTRSRKIDIAEDHTALAIQTPLPETPTKSGSLAELSVAEKVNAMSTTLEEVPIAAQVKQLKAAYRDAIGVSKKGKRGKGKQVEDWEGVEKDANTKESPVPEATRQLLQSREGSLVSLLEKMALQDLTPTAPEAGPEQEEPNPTPSLPSARLTRRQLAMQQAGQYTSTSLDANASSSSALAQRDSFFTSLFGGRRPAVRPRRIPLPSERFSDYESMTDQNLHIAEEELMKSTQDSEPASKDINVNVCGDTKIYGEDGSQHIQTHVTEIIRTPAKQSVKTLEEVEQAFSEEKSVASIEVEQEDSFVEQITCRSPAKPVSRIEDSVEALDRLEEALEALDQAVQPERIASPKMLRNKVEPKAAAPVPKAFREKVNVAAKAVAEASQKSSPPKQQTPKTGYASMRVKPTAPKQRPSIKKATSMIFKPVAAESDKSLPEEVKVQPAGKAPVKRPISLLPPKGPLKSTKPPTRASFELPGEAVARKLKEQREARLAQRESNEEISHTSRVVSGPKTIKSAKPPTKSTFELPGEALSRRKREAHEARLKAQEEEDRKRREFKAKPLRKSIVPGVVPRDTVASRARQSRIGLEHMEDGDLSVAKRGSNVGAHRPSLQQLSLANMSAQRAPGPKGGLIRKPSTTSGPSMSGLHMQRTVSDKEVLIQRQRAKEIYTRDAKLTEDMEREKQAREAAAKRAREEAAERGRQASRDWAEKQRVKKLTATDKGLGAGYGPGGQLGLSR